MHEPSRLNGQPCVSEQKGAALEAVLYSQTFTRADLLKDCLRYACELELDSLRATIAKGGLASRPQNEYFSPN
jgi:hypothetical protein